MAQDSDWGSTVMYHLIRPPSEVHRFQDHHAILISNIATHGCRQPSQSDQAALDSVVPPFLHHLPFDIC